MGKLTDIQIRAWVRAAEPIAKSDGDGLTFTLSSNGTSAWVLRYRLAGKQRENTLGRFPDISLKRARELATENRAQIQQGVDVARVKQTELRELTSAWTVKQLAADYETKVLQATRVGCSYDTQSKTKNSRLCSACARQSVG